MAETRRQTLIEQKEIQLEQFKQLKELRENDTEKFQSRLVSDGFESEKDFEKQLKNLEKTSARTRTKKKRYKRKKK